MATDEINHVSRTLEIRSARVPDIGHLSNRRHQKRWRNRNRHGLSVFTTTEIILHAVFSRDQRKRERQSGISHSKTSANERSCFFWITDGIGPTEVVHQGQD